MNNKEFTKKESLEKLVKLSGIIKKAIKVLQIIAIVGMILCAIAAIVSLIGYGLDWATKIYENNPEIGKWTVGFDSDIDNIIFEEEKDIEQLYLQGNLDKLMLGFGLYSIVGLVYCAVAFVVLCLFKPLFVAMNNAETPFTYEILKRLRFAFILVFVMLLFISVVSALIVGGILACVYFIYMYGVKMQEDEDTTL